MATSVPTVGMGVTPPNLLLLHVFVIFNAITVIQTVFSSIEHIQHVRAVPVPESNTFEGSRRVVVLYSILIATTFFSLLFL